MDVIIGTNIFWVGVSEKLIDLVKLDTVLHDTKLKYTQNLLSLKLIDSLWLVLNSYLHVSSAQDNLLVPLVFSCSASEK